MSDPTTGDRAPSSQPGLPPAVPPPPIGLPTPYTPPHQANGFAVASLVLGIVGIVLTITIWLGPVCDVLAIVFGAMARGRIPEGTPGRGMATAGFILGIVGLALTAVLVLLFFAAFSGEMHTTYVHSTAIHIRPGYGGG